MAAPRAKISKSATVKQIIQKIETLDACQYEDLIGRMALAAESPSDGRKDWARIAKALRTVEIAVKARFGN